MFLTRCPISLFFLLIIFLCYSACVSCDERKEAMDLFEIWANEGWPSEEIEAPVGFKITPHQAFLIVAESKKLSLKHRWICYRDDNYYYIADVFAHPPSAMTAFKYGVRVNGQSGILE